MKQRTIELHKFLIKNGMFNEASRVFRALRNNCTMIELSNNKTDFNISIILEDKFNVPSFKTTIML